MPKRKSARAKAGARPTDGGQARPATGGQAAGAVPGTLYEGIALLADPLYGYIQFTLPAPSDPAEPTEKDLIDSPWLQRLRRIHQLQSTWWVYPAGEHSRFQHVLGVMHMAGRFADQLYPSLRQLFPRCPSLNLVKELLRVTGLVHDVGHGPFSHFFDENFLAARGLNHEVLGQQIVLQKLAPAIRGIRRGPDGPFVPGESLDPQHVAFLMKKPERGAAQDVPEWLRFLQPVFSGIYTADNMDYVQRDAYMTGFSLEMVDIERLLFYSFFTEKGLTLHQAAGPALARFVQARLAMYSDVYFHRTNRAIDLHMREIFQRTLEILVPYSPAEDLDRYLEITDWFLLQEVMGWPGSQDARRRELGAEWEKILGRRVKWKMVYEHTERMGQEARAQAFLPAAEFEKRIADHLPPRLRHIAFRVDVAEQDTRPLNPMADFAKIINIYYPATGRVSPQALAELLRDVPPKVARYRVFALNHDHDEDLAEAAERAFRVGGAEAIPTNV
jgi:hypothetical protein